MLHPSANRKEMWPTLLAKAVYVIYASCGYHHLQPSSEMTLLTSPPPVNVAGGVVGGEGDMVMMGNRRYLSSIQLMVEQVSGMVNLFHPHITCYLHPSSQFITSIIITIFLFHLLHLVVIIITLHYVTPVLITPHHHHS